MAASLAREDRLCRLTTSTETLCSRTPPCAPNRSHSTTRLGERPAEDVGQLTRPDVRRGVRLDAGGQLVRQLGEPVPQEVVQQLEQHGLAGLEVAQHVRLGQADPPAELVEAHLGHRHLVEHRRRGVQDRPAADLPLLLAARALEGHEAQHTKDRRSLVIRPPVAYSRS